MKVGRDDHFVVTEGHLFEAQVLYHNGEEAQSIMYQGPRKVALWVCAALNSRLDKFDYPDKTEIIGKR